MKKYTVAVLFLLIASLLFSAAFAESLPEEEPVEEPAAEEILAEIDALEFEYPRPVGAETLYVGMSSNEMIGKVFIVFTLSDDVTQTSGLNLFFCDIDTGHVSAGRASASISVPLDVGPEPKSFEWSNLAIKDFRVADGEGSCEIDYTFTMFNPLGPSVTEPLDPVFITFRQVKTLPDGTAAV